MPFGALQTIWILISSYAVHHFKVKSGILALFMAPVLAGLAMLYYEGTHNFRTGVCLAGYYMLSALFGGNPLIVSWMVANTGGQTKKSAVMSLYNAGVAIGNIIGPQLFSSGKPRYVSGVRGVLAIFAALIGVIGLQAVNLYILNKVRQKQRVAVGKPRFIKDTSMSNKYEAYGQEQEHEGVRLGQNGESSSSRCSIRFANDVAHLDLTDYANDEFTYVY